MGAERAIRRRYPSDEAISRAVALGRQLGLDVAGYEVKPDGTIRVFEARGEPSNDLDGLVERE